MFQPGEEYFIGAAMIDAGVLENPKVDAALGMHVMLKSGWQHWLSAWLYFILS